MEEILGLLFAKSFPEAEMEKLHSFQQFCSFIISNTSDHATHCPHSTPNFPKSLLVLSQVLLLLVLSHVDCGVSQDEL